MNSSGPGLVQSDCDHDQHKQEYMGTSNGEMAHRCMGCGEVLLRYIECQGG